MQVNSLASGARFLFHIDFENLTDAELTLLHIALQPGDGFCHRLGLGQSLGMGAVNIRVEAIFLREPVDRYGPGALEVGGYQNKVLTGSNANPMWAQDHRYQREAAALVNPKCAVIEWSEDRALVDDHSHKLVCLIGNPKSQVSGIETRWRRGDLERDGHPGEKEEPPEPLKPIRLMPPLPYFYESLLDMDDDASKWIRERISELTQRDYQFLKKNGSDQQIRNTLAGPGMLKRWRSLAGSSEFQRAVRDRLANIATQLDIWHLFNDKRDAYGFDG
jgi:hypothetical protein